MTYFRVVSRTSLSRDILSPARAALRLAIVAGLAIATGAAAVTAAPTSSPEGQGSGSSAAAVLCERGFVYSKARRGCADADAIDDDELYTQGRALALAGHYARALDALEAVRIRRDARVLAMIGYSKRKLGHFDEGIAAYLQALAIDPNNPDTREYLGEAYVETGRLDLARDELNRIEVLCGSRTCEQYVDLAERIVDSSR